MRTLGLIPLLFSLVVPTMALAAPEGPVILKVTGNLDPADPSDGEVAFDMAMIQALPQHEIVTSNPWVDKPHKYVGPKLADVLTAVKANGKSITLTVGKSSLKLQDDGTISLNGHDFYTTMTGEKQVNVDGNITTRGAKILDNQ